MINGGMMCVVKELYCLLASKGFAKLHGWRREENRVGGIQSKDSHFSKIFIHNTAKKFNDTGLFSMTLNNGHFFLDSGNDPKKVFCLVIIHGNLQLII